TQAPQGCRGSGPSPPRGAVGRLHGPLRLDGSGNRHHRPALGRDPQHRGPPDKRLRDGRQGRGQHPGRRPRPAPERALRRRARQGPRALRVHEAQRGRRRADDGPRGHGRLRPHDYRDVHADPRRDPTDRRDHVGRGRGRQPASGRGRRPRQHPRLIRPHRRRAARLHAGDRVRLLGARRERSGRRGRRRGRRGQQHDGAGAVTTRTDAPPAADRLPAPRLPVSSADLLADAASAIDALDLETRHGNGDLFGLLDVLGIVGPFEVVSPWELRSPRGRHLIHAGGYAALPFGESYPPLVAFVTERLARNRQLALPQQSASEWRAALSANLVALLASEAPSHADSRVCLGNSGAEAVEAAMKMALAHRPRARRFVNFERAYHGKTLGALSLTPNDEYQGPFQPLRETVTLPYGDLDALESALRAQADAIAAIVVEPVLGEGGVVVPPPGFLRGLGELARRHGVLVI